MSRRATLFASLAFALGITASAVDARAADPPLCHEAEAVGRVPIRGTVGYGAMFGAFEKVAQIYGAASMLENRILPMLRMPDVKGVFQYDVNAALGVLKVPICGGGPAANPGPPQMGSVDLSTGGMGGGIKTGPVTLFYVGNMTYRGVRPDSDLNRAGVAFGLPIIGSILSPLAPVVPRLVRDELAVSIDFIAGATFDAQYAVIGAGYIASRGFYGSLMQPQSSLFLSSAVEDSLRALPYLKGGIMSFDWLIGESAASVVGSTSLYGRKLQYGAPPASSVAASDLTHPGGLGEQLVTGHFEQYGIGERVDLLFAAAFKPKTDVYEGLLAYHTKGYLPQGVALARAGDKGLRDACAWGFRAAAGVVKVPDLFYYGVQGGYLARASIDVGGLGGCKEHDNMPMFYMGLALNSSEMLGVFPFARNAVSFNMSLGMPK
jgi:hypothetical protein